MLKFFTALSLFIFTFQIFAQTDHNGNLIFNSVTTNTEKVDDFKLISNYYTLKNNIENKNSSVFISEKPTLAEIENAAVNLPSEFFVINKNQATIKMIMVLYSQRKYFVLNPDTGQNEEFNCPLKGDISENRAKEIIENNYDSNAKITKNKLHFNNKNLTVIPNKIIKEDILHFIGKHKISEGENTNLKLLSKEDLKEIIIKESNEGGKLDFFTEIKGHETDGIQVKPGLFSTKIGIALYQWGRANFELGTNTVEDALEFWAVYKGREANIREKDYIKVGFNKELEK